MGISKSRPEMKGQIASPAVQIKLIDGDGVEHALRPKPGRTLLDLAVDKSVDLPHSCGGMGSCGTCRVRLEVLSGEIPERSEIETEMARDRGFTDDERLSCQLEIPDGAFAWRATSLGHADEEW